MDSKFAAVQEYALHIRSLAGHRAAGARRRLRREDVVRDVPMPALHLDAGGAAQAVAALLAPRRKLRPRRKQVSQQRPLQMQTQQCLTGLEGICWYLPKIYWRQLMSAQLA